MTEKSDNTKARIEAVKDACERLDEIDKERKELSEQKKDICENLEESYGISRKALAIARKIAAMNDDQRQGFDLSLETICEALGKPWTPDLFFEKVKDEE